MTDKKKEEGKEKSSKSLSNLNRAGRPKGSRNKAKVVAEIIREGMGKDYDPAVTLAKIADDPKTADSVRVQAASKLMEYVHVRKGTEQGTVSTPPVTINIGLGADNQVTIAPGDDNSTAEDD